MFTVLVKGVLVSKLVNAMIQICYCSALITVLLLSIISQYLPISSASLFSSGLLWKIDVSE